MKWIVWPWAWIRQSSCMKTPNAHTACTTATVWGRVRARGRARSDARRTRPPEPVRLLVNSEGKSFAQVVSEDLQRRVAQERFDASHLCAARSEAMARIGVANRMDGLSVALCPVHSTTKQVVAHAEQVLQNNRCFQYKFGVCSSPADRLDLYRREGFKRMKLLWATVDFRRIDEAESALICRHNGNSLCVNSLKGLHKTVNPSTPPWFLYLVLS